VTPVLLSVFALTSAAFTNQGTIPRRYTCDGRDVSPPLRWTAPPRSARGLMLLVTDPDAPGGGFVHWRASGIAPRAGSVREGAHLGRAGKNSFGHRGYSGPCPPPGPAHHYVFVLRALDARGRTIASARLVGRYARR
jgi:Raf kinase inhibitor-like YbhB/YbcL family protein